MNLADDFFKSSLLNLLFTCCSPRISVTYTKVQLTILSLWGGGRSSHIHWILGPPPINSVFSDIRMWRRGFVELLFVQIHVGHPSVGDPWPVFFVSLSFTVREGDCISNL